jgi:beta-aspartyl-peptidase (threonine type)
MRQKTTGDIDRAPVFSAGKGGGIIRAAHVFAINDAGMYRGAVSSDSPVIRTALHGDEKLK